MRGADDVVGFEDALRPPVDVRRARIVPGVLRAGRGGGTDAAHARLARIARGAPEVMVKITGRTHDGGHLLSHLQYIGRNGALSLEGPDRERVGDREAVRALAEAWTSEAALRPGRRRDTPLSHAVVLSMPRGTAADRLEDAARAFAGRVFGDRFDYVLVLHDEGKHPHVHLTVCSTGRDGRRLDPRKADLQQWREAFAAELRARGLEAEATPRRVRGVVRRPERTAVRKMRERAVAGQGPAPRVLEGAVRDALSADPASAPWRIALVKRQRRIRRLLLAEAVRLSRSDRGAERALGGLLERFVLERPPVETRADAIRRLAKERERSPPGRSR
ncbi:relaxase/mobilization nuclease domain-containing protein [Brevundimonas sp. GCM10030266]|uniref:relaxase/mobilization nuclease domain-containing protein n=1 Tax=Brevundimonas sp. GCM10030266 TaxID=3273386 RepID=UPI0036245B1F